MQSATTPEAIHAACDPVAEANRYLAQLMPTPSGIGPSAAGISTTPFVVGLERTAANLMISPSLTIDEASATPPSAQHAVDPDKVCCLARG